MNLRLGRRYSKETGWDHCRHSITVALFDEPWTHCLRTAVGPGFAALENLLRDRVQHAWEPRVLRGAERVPSAPGAIAGPTL